MFTVLQLMMLRFSFNKDIKLDKALLHCLPLTVVHTALKIPALVLMYTRFKVISLPLHDTWIMVLTWPSEEL